jgi:hypothetical protein
LTLPVHEALHALVYAHTELSFKFKRVGTSVATLGQPCPLPRGATLVLMLLPTAVLVPLAVFMTALGGTFAYVGTPVLVLTVTGCM